MRTGKLLEGLLEGEEVIRYSTEVARVTVILGAVFPKSVRPLSEGGYN